MIEHDEHAFLYMLLYSLVFTGRLQCRCTCCRSLLLRQSWSRFGSWLIMVTVDRFGSRLVTVSESLASVIDSESDSSSQPDSEPEHLSSLLPGVGPAQIRASSLGSLEPQAWAFRPRGAAAWARSCQSWYQIGQLSMHDKSTSMPATKTVV